MSCGFAINAVAQLLRRLQLPQGHRPFQKWPVVGNDCYPVALGRAGQGSFEFCVSELGGGVMGVEFQEPGHPQPSTWAGVSQ